MSLNYSLAFEEYLEGWREVLEMLRAAPSDLQILRSHRRTNVANALYRGSVVLLSSHLERYVESLVAEAIDVINFVGPLNHLIPDPLRMLHIEQPLSSLSTKWSIRNSDRIDSPQNHQRKISELRNFLSDCDSFFGTAHVCGRLRSDLLTEDFSNPLPERIIRVFRFFGINNVVGKAVALDKKPDRGIIDKKVEELVTKRNSIAHTGMTNDLTREDVFTYLVCSRRLIRGIDFVVGQTVQRITSDWPWQLSRSFSAV